MVVCKYFLLGSCKFGSNCYNEHQIPSNYKYPSYKETQIESTSILRKTNFGNHLNPNVTPRVGGIDVNDVMKIIILDMVEFEKQMHWLLSCYVPITGKPAFPGFEDHSPEEIRYGFYEAEKNGTSDQYNHQLKLNTNDILMKVKALQNPSRETLAIVQNILNAPTSCSESFEQTTIRSTDASNQQSNSLFGQQLNAETNPNSNIFSTTQTNSIFGQGNNQKTDNIFASASKSLFGGGQTLVPSQQSGNIFSTQTPAQSQNIFGTQVPVFQQQVTNQEHNIFPKSSENLFASQIGQQQSSNSPLNPAFQQSVPPSNYSASIFGNPSNINPSLTVLEPTIDESLYSKMEELNEDERNWFENDTLDIMNIPDKPPTYEMCFK